MELAPYVVLTILSVLIGGRLVKGPYDTLRRLLVPVVGVWALVWWWFTGASLNLSLGALWMTVGMIAWWVLSSLMSPHRHLGMGELSIWLGMVLFGMFGFDKPNVTGLMIVMIGVVINCLYTIIQCEFKFEYIKHATEAQRYHPVGFIGNSNILGNFLAVNYFLGLYVASQVSSWVLLVCGLITYVIWLTKCKAGFVGLVGGILFLMTQTIPENIYVFIVLTLGGILLMGLVKQKQLVNAYNRTTAKERLNYWRVAWEQIKASPWFGVGFDGLKCNEPYIQRELNRRTNGKFLSEENYKIPCPQKCHNDYLQMMCDVGIPGLVMYVGLIITALISPIDGIIKGGVVAAVVAGMFLHNLHLTPVNVWIWVVLFICLHSYDESHTLPWYVVCILACTTLATFRDVIRDTIAKFWYQKYLIKRDVAYLDKALSYTPTNGAILVQRAGEYLVNKQSFNALATALKGITDFDCEIRMWELQLNVAKCHFVLGELVSAEYYAKESLEFNPNFEGAKVFLAQVKSILTSGYQVKRMEIKNEPKTDGT